MVTWEALSLIVFGSDRFKPDGGGEPPQLKLVLCLHPQQLRLKLSEASEMMDGFKIVNNVSSTTAVKTIWNISDLQECS